MSVVQRRKADQKKSLCQELASTIKVIQEDHMITKQVKGTHHAANDLCCLLEAIFLHELKDKRNVLWRERHTPNSLDLPEPSFWCCIEPLVSDEIKMQILALRNADSDVKKCRSWIRLMLMKGLLLSFMLDIQKHPGLLGPHYGKEAILKDAEGSEIIIQLLRGLQVFDFEYDFTSPRLTTWDAAVLQLAGIWNPETSTKRFSKRAKNQKSMHSHYEERVSPPPSDFLMGDAVVASALDQYSKFKKSVENLPDDELLKAEEKRDADEQDDVLRPYSCDFSGPSYNTMLQSYARHTTPHTMGNIYEYQPTLTPTLSTSSIEVIGEEDLTYAQSMNFEVVNAEDSMSPSTRNHIQTLTSLLSRLETEKGLDSQQYQCADCKRPIGIIFGEAKLCKFDCKYYCFECHQDDERYVPARILFNWDFRKHRVCVRSCEFLDSIETTPVLNIEEINNSLYRYIPELNEVKDLRVTLSLQKDYILTCKDTAVSLEFKKRLKSSHFYDSVHLYSIKDLKHIHSGSLPQKLRKIVRNATKHIRHCSSILIGGVTEKHGFSVTPTINYGLLKGFICEVCQNDEILFPFDDNTYQCKECRSVYHLCCKPKLKADCPKCLRMEQRRASLLRLEHEDND